MLTLVEEVVLLALDDEGRPARLPEYAMELGAAGAVLMELALRDRIDADPQQLSVVDATPTGETVLDPVLAELAAAPEPQSVRSWLLRLGRMGPIIERAVDGLEERGILRREDRRFLWVFGSRRYPLLDGQEQREARLRVLDILLGDRIPAPRDAMLVCLADAGGLLASVLNPQQLADSRGRVEQVTRLDLIGRQMLEELRDLRAFVDRVGWWGVGKGPLPGSARTGDREGAGS